MAEGPHITRAKAAERSAREARLAKALRSNLRRRKEQTQPRAREEDTTGDDRRLPDRSAEPSA